MTKPTESNKGNEQNGQKVEWQFPHAPNFFDGEWNQHVRGECRHITREMKYPKKGSPIKLAMRQRR